MKILGIIQARLSSSRLPGKVLKEILGESLISHQIKRIKRCESLDNLIVATSIDASDDPLESECVRLGVPFFRGSLDDVLDRFYQAACKWNPDHILRFTGDCPLSDPKLIDSLVDSYLKGQFDYSSNSLPPSLPDGLDAEIFRFQTLERAWKEAKLPSEREHVTPYIYKHPEIFRLGRFRHLPDLSHLRLTVDQLEDFELVRKIFEALMPDFPEFGLFDIVRLLEAEPNLLKINAGYRRNEGYQRSLQNDAEKNPSGGQNERTI